MTDIPAIAQWPTNGHLLADVAKLWLSKTRVTLDVTYGEGVFWSQWRPRRLLSHDLRLDGVDFRNLPYPDRKFSQVVYDPPYKLNGTPSTDSDERYGTDEYTDWRERWALIFEGLEEVARVCSDILLVKCQDQVCSGKVRWQTYDLTFNADCLGFDLVDRFDMLGGRPQPAGRRQVHARRNASTLLVFRRR